ncbi:MAG TPA: dihydrofolate reductase family protein, partial [Pyrinomonadaceae bacterium]
VHELRREYDAILVGAGSAAADDPLLTDRSGLPRHRPLARVLLDDELRLSPDSRLAQTARETPLIVFTSATADERAAATLRERGAEIVREAEGARDLGAVLAELQRRSLQSVLVEGGARVAGMFLDAGLVDKVSFFVAPLIIGGGDAKAAVTGKGAARIADSTRLRNVEIRQHGSDVEITGYPKTVTSDG